MSSLETLRVKRGCVDTCARFVERRPVLVSCVLVLCAIVAGASGGYFLAVLALGVSP